MTAALCRDVPAPPAGLRLAEGIELLGQYQGSGCVEPPYLLRLVNGRMLEISRLLYLVAVALREEGDVAAVAVRVTAECGRPISAESVIYVVDRKLRPLGIVEDPTGSSRPPAVASTPPVLGLGLHAGVIPERLVGVAAGFLRPLFLPPVLVGALAGLVAVDAWLLGHGRIPGVKELLLQPGLVLALVGITLLGGAFHELGHATASRYGGAKPGRIGAGVYLIWPVFYNDLNDSYRLSRAGRLRADLGGVYFNALFILVLAAGYGLTGTKVLLVAIVVQHLAVLQQFVPFLRLDCYYIVSDLAGVPDLFGRIRPVMASLLPGRAPAEAVTGLKPRARAVVTAWVLLTVPLLGACLALLVRSTPGLVGAAAESLGVHGRSSVAALRSGAVLPALLGGLQLVIVAVPFLGLSIALTRLLRLIWRLVCRRPPLASTTPDCHLGGPSLDAAPGCVASGGAGCCDRESASGGRGVLVHGRPGAESGPGAGRLRLRPVPCLLLGLVVVLGASFAAGILSATASAVPGRYRRRS